MGIADSVIRNYHLEGTHFLVQMFINQCKFRPLSGNPLLVKFSPRRFIVRYLLRTELMLLQIVYCWFNEIIGVLLLSKLPLYFHNNFDKCRQIQIPTTQFKTIWLQYLSENIVWVI